jgi:hypothetical protein
MTRVLQITYSLTSNITEEKEMFLFIYKTIQLLLLSINVVNIVSSIILIFKEKF